MNALQHLAQGAEPNFDPDELAFYVRRRAAEVRRLRGLFAPTSIEKLALITNLEPYGDTAPNSWTRLRQAAFVAGDLTGLDEQERVILLAIAMHHAAEKPPIFSHGTARAVLDLPSIGPVRQLIEFAKPPGGSGRSPQARRRRTSIVPTYLKVDELLVTTIDRTIIDSARERSLESAVATADAGLHRELADAGSLLAQARALPKGSRGCKMAELAMRLADGRSESPLESLSRTRMFQLGLPMPELQVIFDDATGFIGRVDFFWPQLGIVGEADGRVKFRVADGLSGREAEEAVWRAKRRDDRLLRHPDVRKVGHWDWGEALNSTKFAQVLRDLGVHAVRDGGWPVPNGPLPRKSRAVFL
ncbi:hypothetical protein [Flexivirga alba]|uniref:Winged helix DNA-binding domain-containing protein n=1 Tax=Flexivirga alba TaxID=702742 RepID=A0ABW2AHK1_9MICO